MWKGTPYLQALQKEVSERLLTGSIFDFGNGDTKRSINANKLLASTTKISQNSENLPINARQ